MEKRRFPPAWAWVALAAALRIAFALKLGGRFHQIDEGGLAGPALRLASTGALPVASPVVSAFFALFFLIGRNSLYPRLAQALVGAAMAWLVGRMTRDLARSETAGRLALALSAVYPFFIYYSGMLLTETLYATAVAAGLWWLCLSLGERGAVPWRAPAAGLALALAGLCRPEGAPISAAIWAAAAIACLAGRWPWRSWLLASLFWALPLAGWGLKNKVATGEFMLDNHGGMAMMHGTVLFDLNEQDTGVAMEALKKTDLYRRAESLKPAERERLYLRTSLKFMLEHRAETARQWGRKLVNLWRFYPRTDKAYAETATSRPAVGLARGALVAISLAFEPWIILGGFWGLWRLRRRWGELFPLAFFLAGTTAIHMVSVSQMRYRLPVMPILILGVCSLLADWNARRARDKPRELPRINPLGDSV